MDGYVGIFIFSPECGCSVFREWVWVLDPLCVPGSRRFIVLYYLAIMEKTNNLVSPKHRIAVAPFRTGRDNDPVVLLCPLEMWHLYHNDPYLYLITVDDPALPQKTKNRHVGCVVVSGGCGDCVLQPA